MMMMMTMPMMMMIIMIATSLLGGYRAHVGVVFLFVCHINKFGIRSASGDLM